MGHRCPRGIGDNMTVTYHTCEDCECVVSSDDFWVRREVRDASNGKTFEMNVIYCKACYDFKTNNE